MNWILIFLGLMLSHPAFASNWDLLKRNSTQNSGSVFIGLISKDGLRKIEPSDLSKELVLKHSTSLIDGDGKAAVNQTGVILTSLQNSTPIDYVRFKQIRARCDALGVRLMIRFDSIRHLEEKIPELQKFGPIFAIVGDGVLQLHQLKLTFNSAMKRSTGPMLIQFNDQDLSVMKFLTEADLGNIRAVSSSPIPNCESYLDK